MNIKNNKRRQRSQELIEKAFIELLQSRQISQISVSDICKITGLNRSTFYANYTDIYCLADRLRDKLESEVSELYENDLVNQVGNDYLRLFNHIKDNQIFYSTYFKLGYESQTNFDLGLLSTRSKAFFGENLEYHIEFHKAGLNAIIKKWLQGGCKESPEAMVKIIEKEYSGRTVIE